MNDQENTASGQSPAAAPPEAVTEHPPAAPPPPELPPSESPPLEPPPPPRPKTFLERLGTWNVKAVMVLLGGLFAFLAVLVPIYVDSVDARYEASREVVVAAIAAIDAVQAGADDQVTEAVAEMRRTFDAGREGAAELQSCTRLLVTDVHKLSLGLISAETAGTALIPAQVLRDRAVRLRQDLEQWRRKRVGWNALAFWSRTEINPCLP